jgi:hypothetical protein
MIRDSQVGVFIARLATATSPAGRNSGRPLPRKSPSLRAAYMVYPYKRPGAVPVNGERLTFFRNCMANQQANPAPEPPSK